jgi:hypothetical protein
MLKFDSRKVKATEFIKKEKWLRSVKKATPVKYVASSNNNDNGRKDTDVIANPWNYQYRENEMMKTRQLCGNRNVNKIHASDSYYTRNQLVGVIANYADLNDFMRRLNDDDDVFVDGDTADIIDKCDDDDEDDEDFSDSSNEFD